MTKFLYAIGVRIFDYPQFASTLRDRVRARAASLAAQAGITIEHIAKSYIRKEAVVAEVLKRRGEHPGLVHVISAMEACGAYQPWHDKQTHKTFVRPDSGKCLTTISISSMPSLAWSICGCRHGHRSACNSTATVTAGWRVN
jgi:hypothetical protein